MGGKGSGGHAGAGRKPKTALQHAVDGTSARVLPHPSAPVATAPPVVEEFDAPNDLTMDERHVWVELAPFAFANGTLVKSTSLAFRLLCRNIVLEKAMSVSLDRGGPNHRGLIQRVDAELLRFNLAPCGKPMYRTVDQPKPAPAVNPLNRFLKR